MTYEEAKKGLKEKLTMLPGRIAALFPIPEDLTYVTKGGVLLSDKVVATRRNLEIPPFQMSEGEVVVSGSRTHPEGAMVAAMPLEGLWVKAGDNDLPELGSLVPPGYLLKIFGIRNALDDQVPLLLCQ